MASAFEITLEIVNQLGLHARCAAMIAEIAAKAQGPVRLGANSMVVDAADILDMLMLAPFAGKGQKIIISVENSADKDVFDELVALVRNGFGEE